MNKTFYDYITRQIAVIRYMLFSLREVTGNTVGYQSEKVLFEAINALVDFQIIIDNIYKKEEWDE